MWISKISRRDLFELALSGVSPKIIQTCLKFDILPSMFEIDEVLLVWAVKPTRPLDFPVLAISSNDEIPMLFSALNASPHAFAPFSAFCRVISWDEAKAYLRDDGFNGPENVLAAVATLSLVEAQFHSAGRLKLKNLSPAACRRTISYVWATAMAAKVPPQSLQKIPERWLETYYILNRGEQAESAQVVVASVMPVLLTAMEVFAGIGSSAVSRLCKGLVEVDRFTISSAWNDINRSSKSYVTYETLSDASREERGAILQKAISSIAHNNTDVESEIICAFLATQVAPGTLEHLDLLMMRASPTTAFWYGLFAALQAPLQIQAILSGFGKRLLRDISISASIIAPVRADISYSEFVILARSPLEELSQRISHSSEIEIELVPLAIATFRFSARNSVHREQSAQSVLFAAEKLSPREQISHVISSLIEISKDLEVNSSDGGRSKKRTKRDSY